MIKIGRIYIHFVTVAMFACFILNGHVIEITYAYVSMLLHETAHLIAAKLIGLGVSHIALYPFGVNLKLKNKIVANLSDEILLYMSGPAVNLVLALTAVSLKNAFVYAHYIYYLNTGLFFINMLPVVPLDGGCIVKAMLSGKIGTIRAGRMMKFIAGVITAILTLAGIYAVYITGYNYSVLLLAVMLIGNVFTQREKYNVEYLRELMFYKDKKMKKLKLLAMREGEDLRDTAKKFMPGRYGVVCEIDDKGKIKRFLTETEIINEIFQ